MSPEGHDSITQDPFRLHSNVEPVGAEGHLTHVASHSMSPEGHVWTQDVPLHVSEPLSMTGHVGHSPPHSIVPAPQPQPPATQLPPIMQAWPQPPQLPTSVLVSTSHPFDGFLSQSA
jgi:hypothetical protein